MRRRERSQVISYVLTGLIVAMAVTGTILMLCFRGNDQTLSSSGAENLKYFTVLSNEFCGIVAAICLVCKLLKRPQPMLPKFLAAAAVGLTFLTVAGFLGPLYGYRYMYLRANLFFHLLLPLTAVAEFLMCPPDDGIYTPMLTGHKAANDTVSVPFRWTLYAMIPVAVYGIGYLTNILINGTGVWPHTNDFYGFLNWGLPAGLVIFAGILAAVWGIACGLRAARSRMQGYTSSKFKKEDFLGCTISTGGGMLGGYHEISLKRKDDAAGTITFVEREMHNTPEETTVYPASEEVFIKTAELVEKYHLYAASRRKMSGIEILDGDTTTVRFYYRNGSFRIEEYQDINQTMSDGLQKVKKYLSGCAVAELKTIP